MRPAKASIIGNRYAIHYEPAEHPKLEGDMGCCEFDELAIYIREGQPLQSEQRTVFHEVLEAVNEGMKVKLRHDQIEQLEIGLMQVLQENPALVAYLRRKK